MTRAADSGGDFFSDDEWDRIQRVLPIACVDMVPVRSVAGSGEPSHYGLILRNGPFSRTPLWCQVGGRIRYLETVGGAVARHMHETLGLTVRIDNDRQPDYLMQWLPEPDSPSLGIDPRKHALSLCYLLDLPEQMVPDPREEALAFRWLRVGEAPPDPLWPGTGFLLQRLGLP